MTEEVINTYPNPWDFCNVNKELTSSDGMNETRKESATKINTTPIIQHSNYNLNTFSKVVLIQ